MTDNEIIKALECCQTEYERKCKQGCPYMQFQKKCISVDTCSSRLRADLLDLINRQKAEIEKFKNRQKPTGASGYKIENGKVVFFTNMLGGYREEKENLEEVVKTLNELLQECYAKDEIAFALKCKTEDLKNANAEIEMLRNTVKTDFLTVTEKLKLSQSEIGDIRAEAVKEFADCLKHLIDRDLYHSGNNIVRKINKLVKEMTEQTANKN
jgi:hypothetical protein